MVSLELIRRYPFFAGLSLEQMTILAETANEEKVEAGHFFLHERDETPYLYLIVKGTVTVLIELPGQDKEIIVSTIGTGEVFAWGALVPPHTATASVKASTPCHVVAIDCRQLLERFEEDPWFAYLMMQRAAQAIRDRMGVMTTETLAYLAEGSEG